jgi:hypothetical protein
MNTNGVFLICNQKVDNTDAASDRKENFDLVLIMYLYCFNHLPTAIFGIPVGVSFPSACI